MKEANGKKQPDAQGFLYGLEEKVPSAQCGVYGLQYLIYFLAGSAIMPVIIGAYLGLDQAEIAQMLQRTFLLRRRCLYFAGGTGTQISDH